MPRISAPTVILTSQDDPIVDFRDYREARFSENVIFHSERFGGHLGYLMSSPSFFRVRRWLDEAIEAYLRAWLSVADPRRIGSKH